MVEREVGTEEAREIDLTEEPKDTLKQVVEKKLSDDERIKLVCSEFKEMRRENTRSALAIGLIAIVGFMVVTSWLGSMAGWLPSEELQELVQLLFGPMVAVLGTAVGFFFGDRRD
jgi:hypothetical protein